MSRPQIRKWDPLTRATLWRESVSHVILLAVGWSSGLGYLGMVMLLGAELLLMTLLSIAVYPERGVRRHLVSLLWFIGTLAFLGLFVVVTYGAAMDSVSGFDAGESPFSVVRIDPDLLPWLLGYTAAHLGVMLLYARTRPNPRMVWSEEVLLQGSATLATVFVMILVALFVATPLLIAIQWFTPVPEWVAENLLIGLLAAARFGMALVMNKLPQSARAEIAANPYVE